MDEKFRSSFIPKQPLVGQESGTPRYKSRRQKSSTLLNLSLGALLVSGLAYGAVYGYKFLVQREIKNMETELDGLRQEFRPAEIAQYKRFDERLRAAERVVSNHVVVSEVFELLSDITVPTVRYTSFEFAKNTTPGTETEVDGEIVVSAPTEELAVTLSGEARTFEDIALQDNEFKKSEFIRNSMLSDFQLKDTGLIGFSAALTLDRGLVQYLTALGRTPQAVFDEIPEGTSVGEEATNTVETEEVEVNEEAQEEIQ